MALTLLCGPTNSGKVGAIFDRYLDDCAGDDATGAWLVVPTRADVARAAREMAGRCGVVVGGHVGTFHNLVQWVVDDPTMNELPRGSELVIVRRLLESSADDVPGLRWPGFASSVAAAILELRDAHEQGVGELEAALRERPSDERLLLRAVLADYERVLSRRGLDDNATFTRAAVDRARAGAVAAPIYVYGFDDLTELQVQLLLAAARTADVTISLPFVPGRIVFQRRQRLVDRLVEAGATVHDSGVAGFESTQLAQLEQRFYEPTAETVDDGDDLRFVECCGDLQEAEAVVREVGRLLDAGNAPDDIACLTVDPAQSRTLLEPAFRRAGIACAFEAPRTVAQTPAGRAVLDALDSAITGSVQRYFSFARSRVADVDADAIDRWQLQLRRRGSDATTNRHAWLRNDAVVAPFRLLAESRREVPPVDAFRTFLDSLQPASTGDARLIASICDALDGLDEAITGRPVTLDELRDVVGALRIPANDERPPGHVVVAPVSRVRTDRFRSVIVFGLHSGGFLPAAADDEAPLIARELAYIAFTRALRTASFVRQSAFSDGRVRAPHSVWLELRRLAPDVPVHRRGLDAVVAGAADILFQHDCAAAVALAHGEGVIDATTSDARIREWLEAIPSREREPVAGEGFRAAIDDLPALRVTDVEGYASCPSRWFVQRHLLRRDSEPPNSRRIIGSIVHGALALLVPELTVPGAERSGAMIRTQAIAPAVQATIDGMRFDERGGAFEAEAARFIVERVMRDEHAIGARVQTEVAFGGDGELPALDVDGVRLTGRVDRIDIDDAGDAVLHDYKLSAAATAANKLVSEARLQLPLYWKALEQSGRYRPVAALYRPLEGTRARGVVRAESGFAVPGGFRNDRLDDDALERLLDEAMDEARSAIAGIKGGAVAPAPRGGSCPDWCDMQSICRVEAR